jgi:hypothetical protein
MPGIVRHIRTLGKEALANFRVAASMGRRKLKKTT